MFEFIEENSTLGGIIKCCGVWMARDCWMSHARRTCMDSHLPVVDLLPYRLLPKLDRWCDVYHDRTFTCLLPYYLPFFLMFVVAICATLLIWKIIARFKRSKPKQPAHSDCEARTEGLLQPKQIDVVEETI